MCPRARSMPPSKRQGRIWGLSRLRWNQQTVQVQNQSAVLRPPRGDGLPYARPYVGRRLAIVGSLDIVFGEIDR